MSDFKSKLGFQDCWTPPKSGGSSSGAASGFFSVPSKKGKDTSSSATKAGPSRTGGGSTAGATTISAADKARLARVVKGAPEVMVKVSRPAKNDKRGNPIQVTRATEAVRMSEHLSYISRNGKIELENDRGETFDGKREVAAVYREWIDRHDQARDCGLATDRTRMTTGIVFSMPGSVNAEAVKDSVRALAAQEFGGRHDYVMALHTDTHHPHVHLTVRTVGHDGIKLNLRKADLQHLRDTFAEKLRTRGIEAESTPRHARGVTRKGEATPVYKIRQRGGAPNIDSKKRREVQRDLDRNNGRVPQKEWDDALVSRRNRVMATYGNAARILEQSDDPADRQLAEATKKFSARMTDVTTQRGAMALDMSPRRGGASKGSTPDRSADVRSREQDQSRDRKPDRGRGPER